MLAPVTWHLHQHREGGGGAAPYACSNGAHTRDLVARVSDPAEDKTGATHVAQAHLPPPSYESIRAYIRIYMYIYIYTGE